MYTFDNKMSKAISMKDKHVGVFPFEFDAAADKVSIPSTIHLIPIGSWEHDAYGAIIITPTDIAEFIQNFNAQIRKGVFITAGHEGFEELPAVGWITRLEARDSGLWGDVEWNQEGRELLSDKAFKFFSPEFYRDYEDPQTHQLYRNVLTGGALTKSPYFKELEAVVFSEKAIRKQFNDNKTMNLKDLLAKDITTLTDEEKTFIKEHASDLSETEKASHAAIIEEPGAADETEEEKTAREAKEAEAAAEAKKAEDAAAEAKKAEEAATAAAAGVTPEAAIAASEVAGKLGKVMISAAEHKALTDKADKGAAAFAELEKNKITASVNSLIFSKSNTEGRFLPKSTDTLRAFVEKLNDAQRTTFSALIAQLPKASVFSGEVGKIEAADGSAQAELNAKVEAKMKENGKLKYSDALKQVLSENPGLENAYDTELPTVKKQA